MRHLRPIALVLFAGLLLAGCVAAYPAEIDELVAPDASGLAVVPPVDPADPDDAWVATYRTRADLAELRTLLAGFAARHALPLEGPVGSGVGELGAPAAWSFTLDRGGIRVLAVPIGAELAVTVAMATERP